MQTHPFVLSGGGARGFAHLGAVKSLEEHGIQPGAISGSSAGAIAGAFLACGFTPDEIMAMFVGKMKMNLLSWNSSKMGFVSMKNIRDFLLKNLRCSTFENLRTPLFVAATNFVNGRQKIFSEGNLIDAVVAASSVPVMFPPVFIDDIPYVDGGLSNDLPIEPFDHRRSETVCSYVNPVSEFTPKKSILEVMDRAWHLSFREMVDRSSEGCYLYIEPPALCKYGMWEVNHMGEIFEVGYEYTAQLLRGDANS
jgi:NTE family protein